MIALSRRFIFIPKGSDKFLSAEYWYHAFCRIVAYVLAGILGVRIGYPLAKNACNEFWIALSKNTRLLLLKEQNSVSFGDFIGGINLEVKKTVWRAKILKRLARLDKHSPSFFPLYFKQPREEYFARYKWIFKSIYKWRIGKYCDKRKTLEALLDETFIDENILVLNVRYPVIAETDFTRVSGTHDKFKFYKTAANIKANAAKMISSGVLIAVIIALLAGSVMLSIDEALLEARVLSIFSIIINSILDVGVTLWKFLSAYMECPRIVRQEDLRSVLDQNEILVRFKQSLTPEQIAEYDKEVAEMKAEEEKQRAEIEKA